jgi:hypothetical protein
LDENSKVKITQFVLIYKIEKINESKTRDTYNIHNMKYITKYRLFENSDSDEVKEDLEFILIDLKDIQINYSIIERSKFLDEPHKDWFRNTRVESGFKDYVNVSVSTNKNHIEEIVNIVKECIGYMTNRGWKYHTTIDRGVRIIDLDLDELISLYNTDISKYLGEIHIHFWKL